VVFTGMALGSVGRGTFKPVSPKEPEGIWESLAWPSQSLANSILSAISIVRWAMQATVMTAQR